MARSSIRKKTNSYEFLLQADIRQEKRQKEAEQKLIDALNSCSRETKLNYSEMLTQNCR